MTTDTNAALDGGAGDDAELDASSIHRSASSTNDKARPPGITVGAGLNRPQGRFVDIRLWSPSALARAIESKVGPEAWWSPHLFTSGLTPATESERKRGSPEMVQRPDNYRHESLWVAAIALSSDLDWHDCEAPTPPGSDPAKMPPHGWHVALPPDVAARLLDAIKTGKLSGSVAHLTPRGLRAVHVLAEPCNDAAAFDAANAACGKQLIAELAALGLAHDGKRGLKFDENATDRARLLYAPNATVKGTKRSAQVFIMRDKPYTLADFKPLESPIPAEPTTLHKQPDADQLPPPPLDALPGELGAYIEAEAANRCVDPAMPFTFALGVAAAAIGRAAEIQLRPGWLEIAAIWLGHVALPGKQKSPTLKTMAAPLFTHDDELDAKYAAAMATWEEECDLAEASKSRMPESPKRQQSVVSDTTLEALCDVLEASPRVCGLYDELGGLFDGMGQYKKRGGHDRQAWLSLHAGQRITVNRKGKDALIVPKPRLGIIGATTPATAARVLDAGNGDGMVDRFFLTASANVPNRFYTPAVPDHLWSSYQRSIALLCSLPATTARVLMLSPEAARLFADFYESLNVADYPPHFQGVIGKLAGHVGRIALTLALWGNPRAFEVSGEVMAGAIRMGEWLCEHTAAVRAGQTSSSPSARLLAWLRKRGGRAFLRDIVRANVAGVRNTEEAKGLCNELVDAQLAVWAVHDTTAGNERIEIILTERA